MELLGKHPSRQVPLYFVAAIVIGSVVLSLPISAQNGSLSIVDALFTATSEEHAKILIKVGASEAVIPEKQMAVKVAYSLAQPNLIDYLPLGEQYHIVELVAPEEFVGKNLAELQLRSRYELQVIATKNSLTGRFTFVFTGDYQIKATDILVVLGKQENINKLRA